MTSNSSTGLFWANYESGFPQNDAIGYLDLAASPSTVTTLWKSPDCGCSAGAGRRGLRALEYRYSPRAIAHHDGKLFVLAQRDPCCVDTRRRALHQLNAGTSGAVLLRMPSAGGALVDVAELSYPSNSGSFRAGRASLAIDVSGNSITAYAGISGNMRAGARRRHLSENLAELPSRIVKVVSHPFALALALPVALGAPWAHAGPPNRQPPDPDPVAVALALAFGPDVGDAPRALSLADSDARPAAGARPSSSRSTLI
eukprot:tig00000523_g1824.t1